MSGAHAISKVFGRASDVHSVVVSADASAASAASALI
jgi:hypothetical protein